MRVIDRKWTELAAGYQVVCSLQARLETEFTRAVEVGYEQQYARDLAAWQKKRRVFIAFAAISPLSIIVLCLSAFYFKEVACVIIYWAVVVIVILVTLGVAARNYIGQVMDRPRLGNATPEPMSLEKHWWQALAPEELGLAGDHRTGPDFLATLADLPVDFLARRGPLVEGEGSLYVFAPSGPWIFTIRDWSGNIIRQEDVWKEVPRRGEPITFAQPPDEQWARSKDALANILNERYSQLGGRIQGGVVFIDPKVHLFKDQIQGNTAAYGQAKAWQTRLGQAPAVEGLTIDMQLEALDALIAREVPPDQPLDLSNSAKELAMRLFQQAVTDLRRFVGKMVS